MSIKGFSIGGVTQKYDYNALDNIPEVEGLSEAAKQALLQLAQKVAYIDDQGQTYYQDLYNALYPPKTVVSITAVFEQGTTVIYDDTALNDLKQHLTVTAKYDDNTTAILSDSAYSLSGLLEAPSSTVTVLYNGVSTTFSVAVTARPTLSSISAVYTQSGTVYDTDTLDSLKDDLVVTAHYSDSSTQTVPAADYTLSGTLTDGTSTITVSYGGKTTTFNVTVTDHRQVPTDYTWLYEASNGILLRNDSFITQTSNGTVEEKIENDLLYIKTTGNTTNSMYKLADATTTDAVLSCRAKLLTSGYDPSIDKDGRCFQLLLSNGSAGAMANIWFLDDYIHVTTYYGNAETDIQKITTSALKDDFHIFKLKVHNGVQSLDIDGQTVFSSSNLSAFYTTMNRLMVQNKGSAASSVQFDWIAYKEN